jgi:hypothetical protein
VNTLHKGEDDHDDYDDDDNNNNNITQKSKERWRGKRMHGKFPHKLDKKLVDNEQSIRWLKLGDIKGETERTVMAVQTWRH